MTEKPVALPSSPAPTFDQFQRQNIERASNAFPPQCLTTEFLAIAIAGEAGEMCNFVKKVKRGDYSIDEKRAEILDELADIMTYCDLFMSVLNEKTIDRLVAKFAEVSARRGWVSSEKAEEVSKVEREEL
jgi:NTP pyrophosphatase (non-canonical NTP hydrolase)